MQASDRQAWASSRQAIVKCGQRVLSRKIMALKYSGEVRREDAARSNREGSFWPYSLKTMSPSPSSPSACIGDDGIGSFCGELRPRAAEIQNHRRSQTGPSGEHYFPSGKLFKLTLVLEPFRMRFEIGNPAV